jgi:hypothetical protein
MWGLQLEPDLAQSAGCGHAAAVERLEGAHFFCWLFTTYSPGKSKSALRKPNLNILYEIGHQITKLDSRLGAAGRAEN